MSECDKSDQFDSSVLVDTQEFQEILTQEIREDCWTDNQKYANSRFFWDVSNSPGGDQEGDEVLDTTFIHVTKYFDTPIGSLAYPECPDYTEGDDPSNCGSSDCQATFPSRYEFTVKHPFGSGLTSNEYQLQNPRPSGENDGFFSDYSEEIDVLALIMSVKFPAAGAAIGIGNYLANNDYFDPVSFSGDTNPNSAQRQEFYWDIDADTSKWPTDPCETVGVELEVDNNRPEGKELPLTVQTRTTALIPAYTTDGTNDFEDGICPCEDDVIQVVYTPPLQVKNVSLTSVL